MFLGKNPNMLPNTCCLDKARMGARLDSERADSEGNISDVFGQKPKHAAKTFIFSKGTQIRG
jgi:hypothetical protein